MVYCEGLMPPSWWLFTAHYSALPLAGILSASWKNLSRTQADFLWFSMSYISLTSWLHLITYEHLWTFQVLLAKIQMQVFGFLFICLFIVVVYF